MNQNQTIVKGYKVVNPNYTSKHGDIVWEVGKSYTQDGEIKLCNIGFHFCEKAQNCFNYYTFNPENHVLEVEASGTIEHGNDKSVCSEIKIIRELTWDEVLKVANDGVNNTGFGNSGNWNSGDSNSGDKNSGDCNSGYKNSGNWNSGDKNSGDSNSGNWNSGDSNSGDKNSGNWNSGYRNSGDSNPGNWNSGDSNSGNCNSGYKNSGNWNSGNWNSGDRNSGDCNSGYRNSGAFCTDDNPTIYLFNKPSGMTAREWENHEAVQIMSDLDTTIWVPSEMMSKEEKDANPEHETTGGYLKTISLKEAWANLWNNLSDEEKKVFTTLPNFSWEIFTEITGIEEGV